MPTFGTLWKTTRWILATCVAAFAATEPSVSVAQPQLRPLTVLVRSQTWT